MEKRESGKREFVICEKRESGKERKRKREKENVIEYDILILFSEIQEK